MARNNKIKTVIISVHLGGAPSFDVRADELAVATPLDCHYTAHGTGPDDADFLQELLNKLLLSYGKSTATSLCLDGVRIQRESFCD